MLQAREESSACRSREKTSVLARVGVWCKTRFAGVVTGLVDARGISIDDTVVNSSSFGAHVAGRNSMRDAALARAKAGYNRCRTLHDLFSS